MANGHPIIKCCGTCAHCKHDLMYDFYWCLKQKQRVEPKEEPCENYTFINWGDISL